MKDLTKICLLGTIEFKGVDNERDLNEPIRRLKRVPGIETVTNIVKDNKDKILFNTNIRSMETLNNVVESLKVLSTKYPIERIDLNFDRSDHITLEA